MPVEPHDLKQRIQCHQRAFSVMQHGPRPRDVTMGIYGHDGQRLPDTDIQPANWHNLPPDSMPAEPATTYIYGPAFFAGSFDRQFGFSLIESLGRLWALQFLPENTLTVFAVRPQHHGEVARMLTRFCRAVMPGGRVNVATPGGRVWYETLYTAPELFGATTGYRALPGFYDWVDQLWPVSGPVDAETKLYVSRAGLGPAAGRFACEAQLEQMLQAEGYTVFHPQDHSIPDQVRQYQRASKLIFAEGSALHLFSLVRRPEQLSAVIQRRDALPDVMAVQSADRKGPPTQTIDVVRDLWWPPHRGSHLSRATLDFDRLGADLQRLGLISGRGWRAVDLAEQMACLQSDGQALMTGAERQTWLAERRARRRGV